MNTWLYNFLYQKIKESNSLDTANRFLWYGKNNLNNLDYINLKYQLFCKFNLGE